MKRLSTRRKSVAGKLSSLRREEACRIAEVRKSYRARREMALLADEVGRRLVRAGVFDPPAWDYESRSMITDCQPEFDVEVWQPTKDGKCEPVRVHGRTVLATISRALNCKFSKDYIGSPSTVTRTFAEPDVYAPGRDRNGNVELHFAMVSVWLAVTGPMNPESDDGLASRLKEAGVRVCYSMFVPLPQDGSPVVLGRSMSKGGRLVECRLEKKTTTNSYVTVSCNPVE